MNPEFKNENALLYAGQNVKIGILNPQFNIVQEDEQVSLEEQKFLLKQDMIIVKMLDINKLNKPELMELIKLPKKLEKLMVKQLISLQQIQNK